MASESTDDVMINCGSKFRRVRSEFGVDEKLELDPKTEEEAWVW